MGLYLVELVMAFEESFGISFPASDSEKLETPGMVTDYVVQRLRDKGERPDRKLAAEIVRLRVIEQLGIRQKTIERTRTSCAISGRTDHWRKR